MVIKEKEYILCAAIWYKETNTVKILPVNANEGTVICGHRHAHCICTLVALTGKRSVTIEIGKYEQGFLINLNRFVNRKEAAKIAYNAKQVNSLLNQLYSENLY